MSRSAVIRSSRTMTTAKPAKPKVGRPRRAKRPADQLLGIRVTKTEMDRLQKAAGYMPVSTWARQTLFAAADKILGEEPNG